MHMVGEGGISMVRTEIRNVLDVLKQNKRTVLVFLIGIIVVDSFFVKTTSDIVTFGVLFMYGASARMYRLPSRATFLLCLGLLGAMFVSFLMGGASIPTEKAAVWFVLFMALGIYQQWRE